MPEFNRPKGPTRYNYLSVNKQPVPSLEIDADFNNLNSMVSNPQALIQNYSDWKAAGTPTYIAGNQFSVTGDHTEDFAVNRAVKGTVAGNTVYSYVQSVSYGGGITTVTLTTSVLTSGLTAAWFGILSIKTNLPKDFADTAGGFGVSQTPGTANKAVVSPGGSFDLKPWLKKITGVAWIAHGDNVVNFPSSLRDGYIVFPQIVQDLTRNKKNPLPYKFGVEWKREGFSQIKVNVKGGYGFTSCGYTTTQVGTVERFDDVTNAHTGKTAATVRYYLSGYSLNGYGFSTCGQGSGVTERFDDVTNAHTTRTAATAKEESAGYSLNGYGFSSCGVSTGVTERFDDIGNTQTGRTSATARDGHGYSLNGYGFTTCGNPNVTERFDDLANTQTGRNTPTARTHLAGYSINGFGFTSCGFGLTGLTERFDDITNGNTTRTSATARYYPCGYSLNGYGFTSGGYDNSVVVGTTERFDDVANSHTGRTALTTPRRCLAGYAINEFFISYIAMNVS